MTAVSKSGDIIRRIFKLKCFLIDWAPELLPRSPRQACQVRELRVLVCGAKVSPPINIARRLHMALPIAYAALSDAYRDIA
jgi:hypothetical protein